MKKKVFLTISLTCCILAGCVNKMEEGRNKINVEESCIIESDIEERENIYEILEETFIDKTIGNIDIKYPQMQGLADSEIESKINKLIKDNIFETQINEQVEEVKNDIEKYGSNEAYYLELDFEITMQTDKILSILYTGIGSFETSQFPTYNIYAIVIDLQNGTMLMLSDFIEIDNGLIDKMKNAISVTNGLYEDEELNKEELFRILQIVTLEDEEFILKALKRESSGYYTFAIKPDSLLVSIAIAHASGDYILVEIPYEHVKD